MKSLTQKKLVFKHKVPFFFNLSFQSYNLLFLGSLVSILGIVFGINCFVDPYNIFPRQQWSSWFQNKPALESHIRLSKYMQVPLVKPNVLLLGSSRIAGGMKITEKALSKNQVVYNLGLPAAPIDELKYYLQYVINNDKDRALKRVILGIDFFMFNTRQLSKEADQIKAKYNREPNFLDYVSTYFSLDALSSTTVTIESNFFPQNSRSTYLKMPIRERFKWWLGGFYKLWYNDYSLSIQKLNYFREIVELCRKHNIQLDIFISPIHATHNQIMNGRNLWPTYEQWKKEIVNITPVWDFSDFSSITTEPISEQMKFYIDNSHYTPIVGDMIERRMSGKNTSDIPEDFGILINTDNIDDYLKQVRLHRQNWMQSVPRDRKFVDDIVQALKRQS
jgi:hypothetical protein